MSKKPKTEFQKHKSRMAKLEHRLKVEEEERMRKRKLRQAEKEEGVE
ncbi:MAG: hypothetical protein IJA72_02375 [Clostridia bacterium]|nr:hypothetical protein [Clostridia bacterium]